MRFFTAARLAEFQRLQGALPRRSVALWPTNDVERHKTVAEERHSAASKRSRRNRDSERTLTMQAIRKKRYTRGHLRVERCGNGAQSPTESMAVRYLDSVWRVGGEARVARRSRDRNRNQG